MKKHFLLLLVAGALSFSCNKDKNPVKDAIDISQTANDQASTENEFNSIYETADDVLREDPNMKGGGGILPECASVSRDTVNKIITIDFGSTNCLGHDGIYRRGKIIIHHTGKYRVEGSVIDISLDSYFVNDNKVEGTKTITNLGNEQFKIEVKDASIAFGDGTVKKWNRTATITRVEGAGTNNPFDDVFTMAGTSSGTNRKGRDYTASTTTFLKKKMSCPRNFVSGVVKIEDTEGNTLILNYDPIGGEPCDRVAEVTINGGTPKRITLR